MAMNCKAFHQNLEDYLEGGLDFSGRFGMERHAQQCICCGKEMSDAQRLRRMASELQRVKAPANFEASILREIGARKAHGRLSGFRSFWLYGFEWPAFRKLALASSSLAVLFLGAFYVLNRASLDTPSPQPQIAAGLKPVPIVVKKEPKESPAVKLEASLPKKETPVEIPKLAKKVLPPELPNNEPIPEEDMRDMRELRDVDYVEYFMPGPDSRPVPVRLPLPKVIPMRYGQMSEEYFIRNVSH